MAGLSIWTYLYGSEAEGVAASMSGEFQRILNEVAAGFAPEQGS